MQDIHTASIHEATHTHTHTPHTHTHTHAHAYSHTQTSVFACAYAPPPPPLAKPALLTFVWQLLAGQPRALHDFARYAQARAHVQPHRPQARFARAAVHKPSEKLACVGAVVFRALRVHPMLALFVHAPQTRLRISLLYF